jgi:hypothetical protein
LKYTILDGLDIKGDDSAWSQYSMSYAWPKGSVFKGIIKPPPNQGDLLIFSKKNPISFQDNN